jgi:hypothetical protein
MRGLILCLMIGAYLIDLRYCFSQINSNENSNEDSNENSGEKNGADFSTTLVGCFIDKSDRDLNGTMATLSKNNTIENCAKFCWNARYNYFGVQYG